MKKLLKYCKFEEDNEDKSDLSTKPLQVKTFEQLEQIYLTFFVSYIIVFMRGRHKCVLHSFSLNHGFIPLGFHGKVFNEADYCTLKRIIAHSKGYYQSIIVLL